MSEKSLRIGIVVLGLLACYGIGILGKKENEIRKKDFEIKTLKNQIDSISSVNDSLYIIILN